MLVDKKLKAWVFITLCSLLIWIGRLIPASMERFYNIVFVSWDYYPRVLVGGWMYLLAAVGNVARLIAVIIGLGMLILVWNSRKSFLEFKGWVATALSLESLYYTFLIPSSIFLLAVAAQFSGVSYALAISYIMQIIFTVPFLLIVAFKLVRHGTQSLDLSLLKWFGVAFSGYAIALWANSVFRWFDMIGALGIEFFFAGIMAAGALNAFIFMSLAVGFAVVGTVFLVKQKRSSKKWFSLSLTVIGLHYIIFVAFSYLIGAINSIWLIDIWAIPLFGLGLSILMTKVKPEQE
jgi:hypothetical protein